ncbi:hypothetical protein CTAM01_10558 [Colletotrichum tamarilloi]|uniref:Uncharacterized protein n=1 Tax=Colletotrichum tamarilloi TaxID=1209934 RepID=A0ABQ9R0S1_9PEZI|nr:uncharacterized protein CTAM01_10558 [Colletotrichum tamarilloi]KAK1490848.1 hypothetical protein CTAM01_10558 [Colletotrichum tamarilloi]
MMENSIRPTAELPRLSRDTLHAKEIPEYHAPNYRAGRLLTNAPHLASEDFERSVDSGNDTTRFLPLTTVFDLEASVKFAHYELQFSQGGFYPMAMDQHDFPQDIKTCRQPGITRHSLAVQGRSSEIVSGKTGRKIVSISFVGFPRENSAGGDLVTHRGQGTSSSIPIGKRRLHIARPDKVYRDISPISSQVADKTDFQGRALSTCGRQFETQTEERCHTRQQDCNKRANQPPDGITHDQQKELKERVDRKLAVKEQWFAVWAIVFPDMPPPESPYVYSPTREVATNMRNYWQESAAEMLVAHADRMPGIDRERVIGGLNTFMETFFNRFIEEHTSVAEGEQVSDSSSDGSPGTAFFSERTPAISSPSSSQRTLIESFRDLLSVMSGAASDNVMIDDGSLIANYAMTMGETDGHWEFPSSDDAYGWGQLPTAGPFFQDDPLT